MLVMSTLCRISARLQDFKKRCSLFRVVGRVGEKPREEPARDAVKALDDNPVLVCFQELGVLKKVPPDSLYKFAFQLGYGRGTCCFVFEFCHVLLLDCPWVGSQPADPGSTLTRPQGSGSKGVVTATDIVFLKEIP